MSILESVLQQHNATRLKNGKQELEYAIVNPDPESNAKYGLRIKGEGNARSFQCNKRQAIELISFLNGIQ
jgi:hypothetical protein